MTGVFNVAAKLMADTANPCAGCSFGMTSERKAQANRANAQKSTGPKTPRGKARAAGNARRLGLSLSVLADPMLSDQVAALTRAIAGQASDGNSFELARRIAEAQIDLQRVRQARQQLVSDRLEDFGQAKSSNKALAPNGASQEPRKLATILMQETRQMEAIDGYERRALSRRRFAIRAFDVERQRKPGTRSDGNFWQNEAK